MERNDGKIGDAQVRGTVHLRSTQYLNLHAQFRHLTLSLGSTTPCLFRGSIEQLPTASTMEVRHMN